MGYMGGYMCLTLHLDKQQIANPKEQSPGDMVLVAGVPECGGPRVAQREDQAADRDVPWQNIYLIPQAEENILNVKNML